MIAKKTVRKRLSSYGRLVKYIVRDGEDPEIMASLRMTNCHNIEDDYELGIKLVEATQALNRRSEADKTYHLIVSFQAGENPSKAQLEDIEDTLVASIGMAEHERISVVHNDTDHLHIHMAINKIHPHSLNIASTYRDMYALEAACVELEARHDLQKTNHSLTDGNPQESIEVHAGLRSFKTWAKQNMAGPLLDALPEMRSWDQLHRALAVYDVELKPRGAGLVLSARSSRGFMAGSHMDRSLGKGRLEARLGPFEPASEEIASLSAKIRYTPSPLQPTRGTLWQEYQSLRQERSVARRHMLADLRTERQRSYSDFKGRHRLAFTKARSRFGRRRRKQAYERLRRQRTMEYSKLKLAHHLRRKVAMAHQSMPTWTEFLVNRAVEGDELALETLRAKPNVTPRDLSNLKLVGSGMKHTVLGSHDPTVRRNGDVIYQIGKANLRDTGRDVQVSSGDPEAILAALMLSQDKWQGIRLTGAAEFQASVVAVAVANELPIHFLDPELKRRYEALKLVAEKSVKAPPAKRAVVSPEDVKTCETWIEKRNAVQAADVLPHRLFEKSDGGKAVYRGVRHIGHDLHVVLLALPNQMIVLPITDRQKNRFRPHRPGSVVSVDRIGRVAFEEREREARGR